MPPPAQVRHRTSNCEPFQTLHTAAGSHFPVDGRGDAALHPGLPDGAPDEPTGRDRIRRGLRGVPGPAPRGADLTEAVPVGRLPTPTATRSAGK